MTEQAQRRLAHDWFDREIPRNVDIGPESWVYSSYAFLHCESEHARAVSIGRHTGVYNGSFFNLGRRGSVVLGNHCTVVGAIFSGNVEVRVGDYALISFEVVIADQACSMIDGMDGGDATARILLGSNVWIGARSIVLGGAVIGDHAIVGAGSVVDFAVPPYAIVAGNPVRIVGDVRDARHRREP